MFNLSGSELVFLLLLALIVLGPEKLPEAVRKFGRVYSELKKMSTGFQTELKTALDEPMREMRETADAFKKAVNFNFDDEGDLVVSDEVNQPADVPEKIQKFDFDDEGGSVPRADPDEPQSAPQVPEAAPQQAEVSEAVEEPASE